VIWRDRKLINQTWKLLHDVDTLIWGARDRDLEPLGVTTQQSAMLHHIEVLSDRATMSNIASRLKRDAGSVSDMLTRLEDRGFVKRYIDLADRRQVNVFLTLKGRETCDRPRGDSAIRRILTHLGPDNLRQLHNYLSELYQASLEENRRDGQGKEVTINQ
jgi:DNA-binding MarR family transcriptional regulator